MEEHGEAKTTDPTGYIRDRRYFWIDPLVARTVRRRDDIALARVPFVTAVVLWPLAITLVVLGSFPWWMSAAYVLIAFVMADKFGAFIHEMVHAKIYRAPFGFIPTVINWGLMPLIGMAPNIYRGLHIGMHHVENNGKGDYHSTMGLQRDRLADHLKLWVKIVLFTDIAVLRYLYQKRRRSMFRDALVGVLGHVAIVATCAIWSWQVAVTVFILPLFLVRTVAAFINSCEHLFIDPEDPENLYRNSTLCINNAFNENYFNAAYHATHHIRPSVLWTDLPERFLATRDECHRHKALILSGITHVHAFMLLVRGRYDKLAAHYVQDPQSPLEPAQVAALIRSRAQRIA